ncbi:RRQRL motif-containing zinc-binding protein [Actinomadura xylanilytica]|uniref:RRQRL motif-containing zinc-binding protein n=1 Tax=Actinomadura xylanilytica TaxID=887459 RepID=UPI00255AD177|nr:RRQRL motif-containing zinc-binding protein [Actinomadura xylanilytica]MDL4772487.1 RRQRL motif-containing zinc-binding protein [Actinomadura xylanilytica]
MTRRRSSAMFFDPTGARYGIPTWPWRMAPPHLLTVRQLAARGLRPGGQPVVAQVLWRSRRYNAPGGIRAAYLYDERLALPKRVPTDRQRAALGKALAARRVCPDCRRDAGYVLPRHLGVCLDCATEVEVTAA